jgi:hypothetical protein
MDVLPKRFGKYALRLPPEKTRWVRFNRPSRNAPPRDGAAEPESFDLLGFTHYGRRSRQGNWVVYRKTAGSRLSRALRATSLWLRRNRHEPIEEQHRVLMLKLRGYYNYYGIIGNRSTGFIPELGPGAVVQVAVAALQGQPRTGCDERELGCVSASPPAHHACGLTERSEPMT